MPVQVPEGLDLTVLKMKKEEKDVVTIPPQYGYGDKEFDGPLAKVPANSTLIYEVELVDHENAKESWEMNDEEKVGAMTRGGREGWGRGKEGGGEGCEKVGKEKCKREV